MVIFLTVSKLYMVLDQIIISWFICFSMLICFLVDVINVTSDSKQLQVSDTAIEIVFYYRTMYMSLSQRHHTKPYKIALYYRTMYMSLPQRHHTRPYKIDEKRIHSGVNPFWHTCNLISLFFPHTCRHLVKILCAVCSHVNGM